MEEREAPRRSPLHSFTRSRLKPDALGFIWTSVGTAYRACPLFLRVIHCYRSITLRRTAHNGRAEKEATLVRRWHSCNYCVLGRRAVLEYQWRRTKRNQCFCSTLTLRSIAAGDCDYR